MRLPALSVIVAAQAIIWCFAGTWIHGWKILLYPLTWGIIGAGFYFHNNKYPITQPIKDHTSTGPWANSQRPSEADEAVDSGGSADQEKISAAD